MRASGVAEARSGNLDAAVEHFTAALQADPPRGKHLIYANRSAANRSLGKLKEALQDADSAVALAPDGFSTAYVRQVNLNDLQMTLSCRVDHTVNICVQSQRSCMQSHAGCKGVCCVQGSYILGDVAAPCLLCSDMLMPGQTMLVHVADMWCGGSRWKHILPLKTTPEQWLR